MSILAIRTRRDGGAGTAEPTNCHSRTERAKREISWADSAASARHNPPPSPDFRDETYVYVVF
jgi:hypothetical protein